MEDYVKIKSDLAWAIRQIKCLKAITCGGDGDDGQSIEQDNVFRVYNVDNDTAVDNISEAAAVTLINNKLSFTITEIENVIIVIYPFLTFTSIVPKYKPTVTKFLVKNLGKNLPNQFYGLSGIPITRDNLELIYSSKPKISDFNSENTQFIDIADLGLLDIATYVNTLQPSLQLQIQNKGFVIFNVVAPIEQQYLFVGIGGLYGLNDGQTSSEFFILLTENGIDVPTPDDNLFLQDFPVNIAPGKSVGRYINGDIIPATGKTKEELWVMVTQEALFPTFVAPSLNAMLSDYVVKEVGTNYTADLMAIFNRGLIKGNLVSGVWDVNANQNFRSGIVTQYTIDGEVQPTLSGSNTITRQLTLGGNSFNVSVNYAQGPQPIDSTGANYQAPLPAGTLTATIVINARRKYFFGPSVFVPTFSFQIRALQYSILDTGSVFGINLNTTRYVIAVHENRTLASVITGNNEDITDNFVLTNVMVQDASLSSVENYNIYTLTTAVPLNLTATVTLQ